MVTPPPMHVPRPYDRPEARLAFRVDVPLSDGALVATFVYCPDDTPDDAEWAFLPTPVLMLHGNGEEHGIFGRTIDAVVGTGRCVVAIDSRAQGESTRGSARLTYELMAHDALLVLDALEVDRAHVLGFSDGAIEGLLLARDHPDRIASLTAMGANLTPAGLPAEEGVETAEVAEAYELWAEQGEEGVGLEDGTPVPSPDEARVVAELLRLMLDEPHIPARSLGSIVCPVTVMAGEYDVVLPCETRRIAGAISGARLVIVPGADHVLPKVAPDVVTDELLATIETAERACGSRASRAATPWET